jgi:hypothetical protein
VSAVRQRKRNHFVKKGRSRRSVGLATICSGPAFTTFVVVDLWRVNQDENAPLLA